MTLPAAVAGWNRLSLDGDYGDLRSSGALTRRTVGPGGGNSSSSIDTFAWKRKWLILLDQTRMRPSQARNLVRKNQEEAAPSLSFSYPTQTGEGLKRNIERMKQSSAREIRQMPSFTSWAASARSPWFPRRARKPWSLSMRA